MTDFKTLIDGTDIEKEARAMVALTHGDWDKMSDIERHGLLMIVDKFHEFRRNALQSQGWQDISSAPKDGSEFIVRLKSANPNWGEITIIASFDNDQILRDAWSFQPVKSCSPTYWRPLPEPPTTEEK